MEDESRMEGKGHLWGCLYNPLKRLGLRGSEGLRTGKT
jgi:hypothetical protein